MDPLADAGATARALLTTTAHEFAVARGLVVVSSAASLVCSLCMIAYFVAFQESRRCGRRVLLCLHTADVGAAVAWLLVAWLPPTERSGNDGVQTNGICMTQGYLLVFFMLASYLWTACFAFHLYQILGRRSKYPELYEHRYHVIAWGIPTTAVVQLGLQQFQGYALIGESGRPWCWFRSWSDYEWSQAGFHIQLAVFYAPVLFIFLHNLGTYISLLYQLSDLLSTKMEDRIWHRMMAYSWVFFLTFIWGVFAFLYQAISPDHELSPIMLYFMSFFTPLQGAMNAFAYGFNKKVGDTQSLSPHGTDMEPHKLINGCCQRSSSFRGSKK